MIKIKNYTNEELEYIKTNYESMTAKQLAVELKKKESSIYNAIRKLNLKKQIHNVWTDEDIVFLKEHFIDMTSEEISRHINHSVHAINTQRDKLNLIRSKEWTECDINFLKENFNKMSHKELGKKLNRTASAITAKCFSLNLYKKELPWEQWEIDFLKDNYMEMKTIDISKHLNRTKNAIELKASKCGMKKYPYSCDYHYFDTIDSEGKAYWLGFLIADGWINKNDKTNSGVVGVEIQYGDIGHLKKFNKSINGNYQITDRWRTCSISKNKEKKNHSCVLRIFSLTMYNTLLNMGFSKNKSYDVSFPDMPKDLMRHFIRGYFDGDGCLTKTNKSFHVDFVTASESLRNDILNLMQELNIDIKDYSELNTYDTLMYRPTITSYDNKIKLLDYIYQDCNIYLDRKYKKYLLIKDEDQKLRDDGSLAS